MSREPESWKKAALHAIVILWTLGGAVAPAPLVPFYFREQIGMMWSIGLSVVAIIVWLTPFYLLYIRKGK
ncbi:hypothetical protein KA089_01665 [Candidatus Woesebacteria bacterium]|nr:hypothetical protein [Candidatus Woesebacteria bacterium]